MKTPEQWSDVLSRSVPWQIAYSAVATEVKALLTGRVDPVTTGALVEELFPIAEARGPDMLRARRRLFAALDANATRELACFARRGPDRKTRWRTTVRPWLWADYGLPNSEAVDTVKKCPHCGGVL